jgi:hypothetical protein
MAELGPLFWLGITVLGAGLVMVWAKDQHWWGVFLSLLGLAIIGISLRNELIASIPSGTPWIAIGSFIAVAVASAYLGLWIGARRGRRQTTHRAPSEGVPRGGITPLALIDDLEAKLAAFHEIYSFLISNPGPQPIGEANSLMKDINRTIRANQSKLDTNVLSHLSDVQLGMQACLEIAVHLVKARQSLPPLSQAEIENRKDAARTVLGAYGKFCIGVTRRFREIRDEYAKRHNG